MSNDLHKNHRKRVRERFKKDNDLDSFEEHQVLELLLFYAIPRRDTNELAHKMINEFGSLYNLMNANPDEIEKRCKVSEQTSVLITMIPHICRKFLLSKINSENIVINSFSIAKNYLEALLAGKPFESFYMMCLDMNKRLKKVVKISDGNSNSSPIYMEKVVGDAILYKSSFVIIGHNHPSGNQNPSNADLEVTRQIVNALLYVNIKVLDHIIICGETNFSFAKKNLCNLKY